MLFIKILWTLTLITSMLLLKWLRVSRSSTRMREISEASNGLGSMSKYFGNLKQIDYHTFSGKRLLNWIGNFLIFVVIIYALPTYYKVGNRLYMRHLESINLNIQTSKDNKPSNKAKKYKLSNIRTQTNQLKNQNDQSKYTTLKNIKLYYYLITN